MKTRYEQVLFLMLCPLFTSASILLADEWEDKKQEMIEQEEKIQDRKIEDERIERQRLEAKKIQRKLDDRRWEDAHRK